MPTPLYTADNCGIAYQLHWSLTAFAAQQFPQRDTWWEPLQQAVEADGVRLFEFQSADEHRTGMFFTSSRPEVAPAAIVRSIKGRLQHLVRGTIPRLWRGHYSITSVGDAKNEVLQSYVRRQVERHPMAESHVNDRLQEAKFHDARIDLSALRTSSHGRFRHNLHLVFENADHLPDIRPQWLDTNRAMALAACQKKGWLLSRLSAAANHLHLLVGCGMNDVPRDVAVSLMNNLAYAHGMRRVFENGFYVGTFGPYDHGAIRRNVAGQ